MKATNLKNSLDFSNYNYFYHETNKGIGKKIMEEGLLVSGKNILETNNILFTTSLPLTKEMISDTEEFTSFLEGERHFSKLRDISEMVIICAPKSFNNQIVSAYNDYDNEGNFYEGIIEPRFILGVINLDDLTFTINPEFIYSTDEKDFDTDGYFKMY